ncbi:hypothetical protein HF670_06435 [Acidithiobacillus thiooxidans]|uniref:Uncharacterized protein n=1 Tax=Acidithiobacillus thiooxidans ATCC 19377 TaxID=637390 RepID=A0A5P9XQ63_ACITH|nr:MULTISPECIES: hypothetical protein [Acidithiobacillus]MBU2742801.1 hypothetical protein [Acidithiobacillus albertensis]MBU2810727.1 hypothetical protein [Acidithiobacillus thiooxidans]MBU2839207.1 hypothetical protein [Acidithiobacillus thiooxidans]MBU2843599.1 hypothetical protein [Acidithiobacillus thiooxidans]MDA8177047.1 hypothetical protein [Acidithiobacillus sp.]
MKKRKVGPLLFALFLVLWAAAMIALVVIGFTNIQPKGIGSAASAPNASSALKDGHHG